MRVKSPLAALGLALALTSVSTTASTQPRRPPTPATDSSLSRAQGQKAAAPGYALTRRLGPSVALGLLSSPRREDRIRGVRRIAGQSDFAAVQILLRALEENSSIAADPLVKVVLVHALAPFASRDAVRRVLASWVVDDGSRLRAASGLTRSAQQQAALALAASADTRALEQLVAFVRAGDAAGDLAAQAILAHPPGNVEPLLRDRAATSAPVLRLLGQLGDLRAIPSLRKALADVDPAVSSEASVALALLGDDSGVLAARTWLGKLETAPNIRVAAARTLLLTRAADAPRAIAMLIADPATRTEGLRLAYQAPTPQLTPTLAGFLTIATQGERTLAYAALSRAGGGLALRTLEPLISRNPPDTDAALALARCPSPAARDAIARVMAAPSSRRLGARMGIARLAMRLEAPDDLEPVLRNMLSSKEEADRETAAFGLVLAGWEHAATFVGTRDFGLAAAACRAALAREPAERASCSSALSEGSSPALRDALGASLVQGLASESLSTRVLVQWAESPNISASVFARLLGARDSDSVRPRIRALLSSGDPVLRAQVALGLARSSDPSSASLLLDAFWGEEDPLVRGAIVRALSRRDSAHAIGLLRDAANLDPDPRVRSLASLAARGAALPEAAWGSDLVWLSVRSATPSAGKARASVRLAFPSGLAVSVLTDADGFVLVPGVPSDEIRVAVAPAPESGQPAAP